MKLDRALAVAVVVVLVAAAVVFFGRRAAAPRAPAASGPAPERLSLLVVGVPGLDPDLIAELSAHGSLPNISALMERGAVGTFDHLGRDVDPAIVWTSLVTGKTPERQGIGGRTVGPRGDEVDAPLLSTSRTADTIWTILSERGRPVVVAGWPGTWPAERVHGVVAGPYTQYTLARAHGGPKGGIEPESRAAELDRLYLDASVLTRKDLARFIDTGTELGYEALIGVNYEGLAKALAKDSTMVSIAERAVRDPGVEAAFVYLEGLNDVEQRFWHYRYPEQFSVAALNDEYREIFEQQTEALGGTIDRYYEFVDGLIGRLAAMVRDDGVVAVVSDHGYDRLRLGPGGQPVGGTAMYSGRGLFLLEGPGIGPGARCECAVFDVAPTILEAASLPVPADLDGAPVADVAVPGS